MENIKTILILMLVQLIIISGCCIAFIWCIRDLQEIKEEKCYWMHLGGGTTICVKGGQNE